MIRRTLAEACTAILLVAFLQAPFAHDHPEDPDHDHAHGFAHAHFALEEHHSEAPELEAHDDDAIVVYREWSPTETPTINVVHPELTTSSKDEPILVLVGFAPEFRPQANSPPSVRLIPPRSPPL